MIPVREDHDSDVSKKILKENTVRSINDLTAKEVLDNSDPDDTCYSADSVEDLLWWLHGV